MKNFILFFIFLFIGLSITFTVNANDATLGRLGETVYPMSNNDVEMVKEDILIDVQLIGEKKNIVHGYVTCTFTFYNTGQTQNVLMGFPATLKTYESSLTSEDDVTLHNFTAYKNGSELEVDTIEGSNYEEAFSYYPKWYVFTVPFEKNETITMTHTYDISFFTDSGGHTIIGYVLETGSTWKDNIGHSIITFNLPDVLPAGISLSNSNYELDKFRYTGTQLIYENFSFKPDFNIMVNINRYYMLGLQQNLLRPTDDFFTLTSDTPLTELSAAYNALEKREKLMETLYLYNISSIPDNNFPPVIEKIIIPGYSDFNFDNQFFDVYIHDSNEDLLNTVNYTLYDSQLNKLEEGTPRSRSYNQYGNATYYAFSDVGTRIFQSSLKTTLIEGNTYTLAITCKDRLKNIANKSFTFVYHNSGSKINTPNPKTGVFHYSVILCLLIFSLFFYLLLYRKHFAK